MSFNGAFVGDSLKSREITEIDAILVPGRRRCYLLHQFELEWVGPPTPA